MYLADIFPTPPTWEEIKKQVFLEQDVVKLILEGVTEKALSLLSEYFKVKTPCLKVEPLHNCIACCDVDNGIIYLSSEELRSDPFVIIHEFCHYFTRGNCPERIADDFAEDFLFHYYNTSRDDMLAQDIIDDYCKEHGVLINDFFDQVNLIKKSEKMMTEVNERLKKSGNSLRVTEKSCSY